MSSFHQRKKNLTPSSHNILVIIITLQAAVELAAGNLKDGCIACVEHLEGG